MFVHELVVRVKFLAYLSVNASCPVCQYGYFSLIHLSSCDLKVQYTNEKQGSILILFFMFVLCGLTGIVELHARC